MIIYSIYQAILLTCFDIHSYYKDKKSKYLQFYWKQIKHETFLSYTNNEYNICILYRHNVAM